MVLKIYLKSGVIVTETVSTANRAQVIVADWIELAAYAELTIDDITLESWSLV